MEIFFGEFNLENQFLIESNKRIVTSTETIKLPF